MISFGLGDFLVGCVTVRMMRPILTRLQRVRNYLMFCRFKLPLFGLLLYLIKIFLSELFLPNSDI